MTCNVMSVRGLKHFMALPTKAIDLLWEKITEV